MLRRNIARCEERPVRSTCEKDAIAIITGHDMFLQCSGFAPWYLYHPARYKKSSIHQELRSAAWADPRMLPTTPVPRSLISSSTSSSPLSALSSSKYTKRKQSAHGNFCGRLDANLTMRRNKPADNECQPKSSTKTHENRLVELADCGRKNCTENSRRDNSG